MSGPCPNRITSHQPKLSKILMISCFDQISPMPLFIHSALHCRYLRGALIIERSSSTPSEGLLLPAVTLCPATYQPYVKQVGAEGKKRKTIRYNLSGWKNASQDGRAERKRPDPEFYSKECKSANMETILNCIQTKTYQLKELVVGVYPRLSVYNVSSDLTVNYYGLCHTITFDEPVKRLNTQKLKILLKPKNDFVILIHDPDFFIVTTNPMTISSVKLPSENGTVTTDYITVTKHIKMNTIENPCRNGFTKCIQDFVYNSIGCWVYTKSGYGLGKTKCSTLDQLVKFNNHYVNISNGDQQTLLDQTGCPPPCEYKEYKILERVETVHPPSGHLGFELMYASTSMTVLREVNYIVD
jgi:hypothetical protein